MAQSAFLIRHMQRSPLTRILRATRAGHRRSRFQLPDGTIIRRKGKQRVTELTRARLEKHFDWFMDGIKLGFIQLFKPGAHSPLSVAAIAAEMNKPAPAPAAIDQVDTPTPEDNEENVSESVPESGYSEDQLKAMSLKKLRSVALQYGVGNPARFKSKQEVIDAIFAAAS